MCVCVAIYTYTCMYSYVLYLFMLVVCGAAAGEHRIDIPMGRTLSENYRTVVAVGSVRSTTDLLYTARSPPSLLLLQFYILHIHT